MITRKNFILPFSILFLLGPHVVYAGGRIERPDVGMTSVTAQRVLASTSRPNVHVEGTLSCPVGPENTGDPCVLAIQDNKTGKTYRIIENNSQVMRIYQSGARQVAVEGVMEDDETMSVRSTQAL